MTHMTCALNKAANSKHFQSANATSSRQKFASSSLVFFTKFKKFLSSLGQG